MTAVNNVHSDCQSKPYSGPGGTLVVLRYGPLRGEARPSYLQVLQLLQALEGLLGDRLDLVSLENTGWDEMLKLD